MLASGLAEQANRRVYLRVVRRRSAPSPSDLGAQVDRALPIEPDVAVILIGVNDVTHTVLPAQSVRHSSRGRRPAPRGRDEVVVGTCPDLGTVKPIAPPLRAGRPGLVAPAGRRPDDRRRRGRRPDGVPGLDPGPGVRRRTRAAVRAGPVPPVRRRLPLAGRGAAPVDAGRARPDPRGRGRSPRRSAARACCRSPRPRSRPSRRRAPSSTAPRSAAPGAACAASGSSCGTAAASRWPSAEAPVKAEAGRASPRRLTRSTRRGRENPTPAGGPAPSRAHAASPSVEA